ncbi:cell division control protein 12 [Apiospora arundinis]
MANHRDICCFGCARQMVSSYYIDEKILCKNGDSSSSKCARCQLHNEVCFTVSAGFLILPCERTNDSSLSGKRDP